MHCFPIRIATKYCWIEPAQFDQTGSNANSSPVWMGLWKCSWAILNIFVQDLGVWDPQLCPPLVNLASWSMQVTRTRPSNRLFDRNKNISFLWWHMCSHILPGGQVTAGNSLDVCCFSCVSFVVGYFPDFFHESSCLVSGVSRVGHFQTLQCDQRLKINMFWKNPMCSFLHIWTNPDVFLWNCSCLMASRVGMVGHFQLFNASNLFGETKMVWTNHTLCCTFGQIPQYPTYLPAEHPHLQCGF